MLFRNVVKPSFFTLRPRALHQNKSAAKVASEKCSLEKIRNIGILAHIDAGKTTTTERMLFYSGIIRQMGEVHDGNTVTDFMEQERERGITICSAAVTFDWKNYRFNLIDTPGHIDFTMGVEQTLGVLDGVVVVLDGSAGVEAQTSTVWRQADRYQLPRIVYVNKMDRADANFDMCLKSIETKLVALTFPVQLPYKNKTGLAGIIDVINLQKLVFDQQTKGRIITKTKLEEEDNKELLKKAIESRRYLTDKLSGVDDELANTVIEHDSLDKVSSQDLVDSLRRVTLLNKGVPVLLGSSYKNIGVQSLMDNVILYLPTPNNNQFVKMYKCFGDNLSARVFKIIHDKQRGPISFFRVYTGNFAKGQKLYNIQRGQVEQSQKLYAAYADDYEEISEIGEGNIAAVTGLKHTITGDLLTNKISTAIEAKKYMENKTNFTPEDIEKLFSIGTNVPDPVFFCSIEPPSLNYFTAMEIALQELVKEDPSLRVNNDPETGQTILAGMGELHLEIIKERIHSEYKIDVDLGELQIAYKETIEKLMKDTYTAQHEINKTKHEVSITLSLIPNYKGKEQLLFDHTKDSAANIAGINPKNMIAIKKGITSAFANGPKLGCPIVNVGVKLHWFEVKRGTSESIIIASVSQCIKKLMEDSGSILLEPIMNMEIVVPEENSSQVLGDLLRRRADIKHINIRGLNKIVICSIPLSELLGYSTQLRILSSGTATFSMEFSHYQPMNTMDEQAAIKRITGF
ncbi:ribosome-releasing factor 2, mitochondrial isoform X1 [Phymastichus coffea]|uniref:ribosome-releasing factor 2, mitochondrial isoform X1 n=1 Tax=Phymastichus coffea TaxID=108790 RepID=UPI00273C9005|nr:ribosome-releasing factor 2, mitochondrial isoform X1 [Phymastichus coffea]